MLYFSPDDTGASALVPDTTTTPSPSSDTGPVGADSASAASTGTPARPEASPTITILGKSQSLEQWEREYSANRSAQSENARLKQEMARYQTPPAQPARPQPQSVPEQFPHGFDRQAIEQMLEERLQLQQTAVQQMITESMQLHAANVSTAITAASEIGSAINAPNSPVGMADEMEAQEILAGLVTSSFNGLSQEEKDALMPSLIARALYESHQRNSGKLERLATTPLGQRFIRDRFYNTWQNQYLATKPSPGSTIPASGPAASVAPPNPFAALKPGAKEGDLDAALDQFLGSLPG